MDGDAAELQSAIDITLQRFTEYQSLQGAFGRRALIEQAKGILMARHATDADGAFEMLRDHSQHNGRKLVDVAQAIVDSHLLLVGPTQPTPSSRAGNVRRRRVYSLAVISLTGFTRSASRVGRMPAAQSDLTPRLRLLRGGQSGP